MLQQFLLGILFLAALIANQGYSSEVVWKGKVSADGSPSPAVDLSYDKTYQIIVNGSVNLGKWVEAGKALAEDASFEYNAPSGPTRHKTLRNSNEIPLDDQFYNADHVYKSAPFVAKQTKIHFWIYDTDYSDNSGALEVQIDKLN